MNHLIVGLGNPGKEFEKTRHNAGWILLDQMFPDAEWSRNSYANAGVAIATISNQEITLLKPATFMNNSGESVEYFIKKKDISPENVIVIYDDIDLAIGKLKISFDRGSGGHNGIKSIEAHLGSREFIRIRIGVSKVLESGELAKPNVLGHFESSEMEALQKLSKTVKKALETILENGKEKAMSLFNADTSLS